MEFTHERISFRLTPEKGEVLFDMELKPPYQGSLSLDHLSFLGTTLVGLVQFQGEGSPAKGTFQSAYLLINDYPTALFQGVYELKEGLLLLSSLEIEDLYTASGTVALKSPYSVNLKIQMKPASVEKIGFLSATAQSGAISGVVKGEWFIEGPWNALKIKGSFEAQNGHLGKKEAIRFSNLFFHLEGDWPLLKVTDARIYREEGILLASGEIDLSQLGSGNPMERVKLHSDTQTLFWKGWDIEAVRRTEGSEKSVRVGKTINRDVRISFTGFINDEVEMERQGEDRQEIELEYRFRGNKSLKMQIKGKEEFLGLENRVKF